MDRHAVDVASLQSGKHRLAQKLGSSYVVGWRAVMSPLDVRRQDLRGSWRRTAFPLPERLRMSLGTPPRRAARGLHPECHPGSPSRCDVATHPVARL